MTEVVKPQKNHHNSTQMILRFQALQEGTYTMAAASAWTAHCAAL